MKNKTQERLLDPRHRKMLNNLLDIKGRDQAIFTRVNNDTSFDVTSKFGKEASEKILSEEEFNFSLSESDLASLLTRVKKATTADEVIKAYQANKEKIFSSTREALKTSFKTTKKELVEALDEKLKKSKARWIGFIRQAIDDNTQENIWSLHVASFFISIKTEAKTIYAPLLLRWVRLSFDEKDNLVLQSEGDWKLNEKVLFILHQYGYEITELLSKDDKTAYEHIKTLSKENAFDYSVKFTEEFVNLRPESIKEDIKIHPGVILGLYKPRGGLLRETMSNIIINNELDKVINPQKSPKEYEMYINKFIENESNHILRIQKSNFSQDKATISALNNDTIIWGPPGTGKSQVIANLIANILYQNKTAVVMSQKKAALDVLKKRLDKLAKFCLFNLNDNNMDKAEFYKPLSEFVKLMASIKKAQDIIKTPFITSDEKEALKLINALKITNQYQSYMDFMEEISLIDQSTLNKLITLLDSMKRDIIYVWPEHVELLDIDVLADYNKIKKTGSILKKYPEDLIQSVKIFNEQILPLEIENIREIIKMLYKVKMIVVRAIMDIPKKLIKKQASNSNIDSIEVILANMFYNKLQKLKATDIEFNAGYDRFVAAVELGRSLPFKLINNHKEVFEKIFPIIITTPQNQFARWTKNQFDYAILDESSQLFVEVGIPVLYLGKTKVLAGDPMQMRPSRWFSVRVEDEDDELEDLPEEAESLLDYGMEKGLFTVMLDKNYRSSYSSLMSFSAKEFYDSKLDVADTVASNRENPIEVINIGGKWIDGVNKVEAVKAVELIAENIDKYESLIVLTFNLKQKMLIEDILISKYPKLAKHLDTEKVKLRNIENIQGDEADLVIASVVYDSSTNMGSTYVSRAGGKHALNVAISRAKDKMIVIKSVMAVSLRESSSEDFKTFKKWLGFLDKQESERKSYSLSKLVEASDTTDPHLQFVNETIQWIENESLFSRHVKLKKDYEVGSKRIDFAILDEHTNDFIMGIEVDSYKYHENNSYQEYLNNASKFDFLVDKGYQMFRIREIDWRLDKLGIIKQLNTTVNLIISKKFR